MKKHLSSISAMDFNPLLNYYGLDLSDPSERLLWNYWEFVKMLVTLSSTAEQQIEIMGFGNAADELALDFEAYYLEEIQHYVDNNLLSQPTVEALNKLDQYLAERSGEKMPDFWMNESLTSHEGWQEVRHMAKEILKQLGYAKLKIVLERTEIEHKSLLGKKRISQKIKTYLQE